MDEETGGIHEEGDRMKKIIRNTMTEPKEMTCSECGSVYTYTYEDIERRESGLFGFTRIDRSVTCPVCKADNALVVCKVEEVKNERKTES